MSQSAIENFMYDDLTFHKKTQKFGNKDSFFKNFGTMLLRMNCSLLISLKTPLPILVADIVLLKS